MEHAVQIVADVAAGLDYAHERRDAEGRVTRIVHRDVSPSNVLVTFEGITKIVDFGIARVQDQIREESGMRPGKMSYMSPEQIRGEPSDHRADIYSLGIILYEITVGRRLWRGPSEVVMKRIVEEQVPPPTYVRRGYPPALELIIMKALEKRASDRQQTAAELQHELLEFMEESGLKSGPRRLARYMKDLFGVEPGGDISGPRAPAGAEEHLADADAGGEGAGGEPDEDLDFDRRAPLMMRVEARPEDPGEWESGPAPVLGSTGAVQPPQSAAGEHSMSGNAAVAVGRASVAAMRSAGGAAATAVKAEAPSPLSSSPVPTLPSVSAVVATIPAAPAAVLSARPAAWRWLVLIVLIGAGVVVFIATK
jgi:hypothetical protein